MMDNNILWFILLLEQYEDDIEIDIETKEIILKHKETNNKNLILNLDDINEFELEIIKEKMGVI